MRMSLQGPVILFCACLVTALLTGTLTAQNAQQAAPTEQQMRATVATLKGNRIATPNNYDTLTPEQKAYVRSILTGPRSSITGPLGVMMVSPGLGDLMQK